MSENKEEKVHRQEATNIKHLEEYLKTVPEGTRIYMGCDSERIRKQGVWWADYCTVVVVHKGGNNGCKIFGEVVRERDYDQKKDKPALRLMNEVSKVAQLYLEKFDILDPFDPEIHLDINPDEQWGSSCVITQAVGYVKGLCGITPRVKPEAFSASYAADRFAYIYHQTSKKKTRRKRRKEQKRDKKRANRGGK